MKYVVCHFVRHFVRLITPVEESTIAGPLVRGQHGHLAAFVVYHLVLTYTASITRLVYAGIALFYYGVFLIF